jgi:hypothetical protein
MGANAESQLAGQRGLSKSQIGFRLGKAPAKISPRIPDRR